MSEKIPSQGPKISLSNRKVIAVLIAVLLVSIVLIGYIVATSSTFRDNPLPIVEVGDKVYVDYVGYFVDYPGGWVFDTSKREVAFNESVAKSLFFVQKEAKEYASLNFTAGVPGNLLTDFTNGVVGMSVTQTKTILISAESAYPILSEYSADFSINQTVPMIETIAVSDFNLYFKIAPATGLTLKHYFWEWDVNILEISGDMVTFQNEPMIGQTISAFGDPEEDVRYGWSQVITSVDPAANGGEGLITVQNLIGSQDIYQKKGADQSNKIFTLTAVDTVNGTFSVSYNSGAYISEIAGRSLYFDITVNRVLKN